MVRCLLLVALARRNSSMPAAEGVVRDRVGDSSAVEAGDVDQDGDDRPLSALGAQVGGLRIESTIR